MMLCPIVCIVEFSWSPIEPKLFLAFSVSQPVEPHVHCLRFLGLDPLIDDAFCHGVVRLYWLQDRECQDKFRFYWRPGKLNYADYWIKHHSASHHKNTRGEFFSSIVLETLRLKNDLAQTNQLVQDERRFSKGVIILGEASITQA